MDFTRRGLVLLTWGDFDEAVRRLAGQFRQRYPVRPNPEQRTSTIPRTVFGVARGGLPLAVALSHQLDLPLIGNPVECGGQPFLCVDDIVDRGVTMGRLTATWPQAVPACWVYRRHDSKPSTLMHAAEVALDFTWFVFPWEDAQKAAVDAEAYLARRDALESPVSPS